jgi:hypothetical protein
MSETLRVVASGAAVIQIVSQVSSGILKLRALLEEIKNDPPKIASLTKKIEILVPLLTVEAIQATFPPGDLEDATLKLCIRHCQRSNQAIADLAVSLSKEVNSTRRARRFSASLKVILHKDTLARLEKELAGAELHPRMPPVLV